MLGLAMRAGKVVIGTEMVCNSLAKAGRVRLVLVASDASESTKKKIRTKCEFYGVRKEELPLDTGEIGKLLGKTYGPAAVAVADEGFAREIARLVTLN